MNAPADLPIAPAGSLPVPVSDDTVWHHRAFCRLALPVRAPSKGVWQREAAGVVLSLEAGEGASLPSGKFARLLLLHLFDSAVRTGDAVIAIGDDPAVLADRIGAEAGGPKLRELQEQTIRLLAARISVAWDGGPTLSVFDARGRGRAATPAWRSSIRMNARFTATLAGNAVALERRVVRDLAESSLAFDLYAWLASVLPQEPAASITLGWDDLQSQFGSASQPAIEFRSALEQALLQVQASWPHFASVMRDASVEFRRAVPPSSAPRPARAASVRAVEPVAEVQPEVVARPEHTAEPRFELAAEPEREQAAELEQVLAAELEAEAVTPRAQEPARRSSRQSVSLKSHLTGLPQVVWLQRANGRETVVIEVTPGGRYDPDAATIIALEPVALQVAGGLYARDFERVAAWAAANRDLIDDWWDSRLDAFEDVVSRVKKVPAPAWR